MKKTIEEVLEFAMDAHSNRLVKIKPHIEEVPYHWHLLRVMLRLGDNASYREKAVALLHDVLEDTSVTKDELKNFIENDDILNDVILCSDNYFPDLNKKEWMEQIANSNNDSVIRVKFSDVCDNLGIERMKHFEKMLNAKPIVDSVRIRKFEKLKKQYPLMAAINSELMVEFKNMGKTTVYTPYFDNLNYLMNSEKNKELVVDIVSRDFSDKLLINKLLDFLPLQERKEYFIKQNLDAWTFKGKLDFINDSVGQKYLAVKVSNDYIQELSDYLIKLGMSEYVENKMKRDKGEHHITVITVADMCRLINKNSEWENLITPYLNQELVIPFYGIGRNSVKRKDVYNEALFAVVQNPVLSKIRSDLNLPEHDFHLTLGFKEKDVFGVEKNMNTVWKTPSEINYEIFDFKKAKKNTMK